MSNDLMNGVYYVDLGYELPRVDSTMGILMTAMEHAKAHDYADGEFLVHVDFREHTFKFHIKQADEVIDVIGEMAFQLGAAISSTYLKE